MASKRIKKKRQKQYQQTLLQNAGYTPKQQKRMPTSIRQTETKRVVKNDRERARRNSNREYLLKQNIPLSIITAEGLDRKGRNSFDQKKLTEYRRKGQKLDALKAQGLTYKQAKSELSLSWGKLQNKYDVSLPDDQRQRGSAYLYIGFSEIMSPFRFDNLSRVSTENLVERINERVKAAAGSPSAYDGFTGIFKAFVGNKEDSQAMARYWYQHGYQLAPKQPKLEGRRYSKITVSNSFSKREFLEMLYQCTTQMKNDEVPSFMFQMRKFCNANGFNYLEGIYIPEK